MSEDTGAKPPEKVEASGNVPRPWGKYGRWGSIFRSYDFEISLPVALAMGALPAWINAVANGAVPVLIAFAGALAAIAGLIIVAITLFVALVGPEYLVIMEQVTGGLRGALRPYYLVVLVSIIGVLTSLAAALAWPAVPQHGAAAVCLRWLVFSAAAMFTSWGLLGAVQVVALGNFHIEQRARLAEVLREVRKLRRPGPQ